MFQLVVSFAMVGRNMGILIQIRDVPVEVHRVLKARAAASGSTLTEYLREMLASSASKPLPGELAARITARGSAHLDEPSEVLVRQLRDLGE